LNSRSLLKHLIFVLVFLPFQLFSQQRDSLTSVGETVLIDKNSVVIKDTASKAFHNPKLAAGLSAILPGLGQAYNKKYWKVPLVYAGFATLGYFIDYNNDYYKLFKRSYLAKTDGDTSTNEEYSYLSADRLIDLTAEFRRTRDLVIIGTVVWYLLNIVDATVDAHLYSFDVSDDLSVRYYPTMQMAGATRSAGLTLCLTF
jgi:hypothetical protein